MRRRPLLYAGLVSLLLWYVTTALALTGHTRLLWGMIRLAAQTERAVDGGYQRLRWLQGDRNVPVGEPADT